MAIEWIWARDFALQEVEKSTNDYLLVEGRTKKLVDTMFKGIREKHLPVVVSTWDGTLVERAWEGDSTDATSFSFGVDFRVNPVTARAWLYATKKTSSLEDGQRRLELLRRLGGECTKDGADWRIQGFGRLVDQERSSGRARSSEKTIRSDVIKAAEDEAKKRRSGVAKSIWP